MELALIIHDMLNSLQSHLTSPVERTSSVIPYEKQEHQRYIQATQFLESSRQKADRILAAMDNPYGGTADRGDEEPHGQSRSRQRLGGHAPLLRLARVSGLSGNRLIAGMWNEGLEVENGHWSESFLELGHIE